MGDADRNRADFPVAARIVDDLRDVFGPKVALVYAAENGREIGRREQSGTVVPFASLVILQTDESEGKGKNDVDAHCPPLEWRNTKHIG